MAGDCSDGDGVVSVPFEEVFAVFDQDAEHAAGVFVAHGVAKAVSVVFDAKKEVFDDFVNVHEFLGALEVFVETGVFAVVLDGFLDGPGMEVRPCAGGVLGDAQMLGDLDMGSAGGADADEGVDHLLVMFHNVVSFCF